MKVKDLFNKRFRDLKVDELFTIVENGHIHLDPFKFKQDGLLYKELDDRLERDDNMLHRFLKGEGDFNIITYEDSKMKDYQVECVLHLIENIRARTKKEAEIKAMKIMGEFANQTEYIIDEVKEWKL